jgi:hypothetical protein
VPDLEVRLADTGAHVTSVALPDGGWPGALERLRQGAAAAA